MIRFLITYCIVLFFCTTAHAVSIDELSKTVVFLRQQSQVTEVVGNKTLQVWYRDLETKEFTPKIATMSGTGVIIKHNNRDYLVTARHVASSLSPTAEIVISSLDGKSISLPFGLLTQQRIIKGARWFHSPKIDVSVHPIAYPQNIDVTSMPEEFFAKKETTIPLLASAYIVGFPLGLGFHENEKLNPVAKEARIASREIMIDDTGARYILLDQALSQGYSGAPVFYVEDIMSGVTIGNQPMKGGENLYLIGIQSGAVSDQTGGKLSTVIPISNVQDIFKSTDFQAYENSLGLVK